MDKTERWRVVKDILTEIIDLGREDRRAFLDRSGIAAETRKEIESLLELEDKARGFMNISAGGLSKDFFGSTDRPADRRLGPYEIVRELAGGGMGVVYLAERRDGKFNQQVAIKLLRREFNSGRIRSAFEREIRIQSRLSHPNITRILDTGVTDDGVPFIVMAYVEGLPIDEFCEKNGLDLKARLKLFAKICESVAFLHQNLIIHRDLKPSNIIVMNDGTPKLLDFGISKLLDEDLDVTAAITAMGAMTPEYASPEQIRGEIANTTSDVFSLGVLLYKILTGKHPFARRNETNGEQLRAITDDDPVPPSAAFGPASNGRSNSGEDPAFRLRAAGGRLLQGDLDNIVLKSLSKEPERRYQSADAFAADIWRFIDDLPVSARPATLSYRTGKFLRRNKIAVAAAALVVASLIVGIGTATWQARLANEQAAIAVNARNAAVTEAEKAKAEQAKSEKVTAFMSKVLSYANPAWYAEGSRFTGDARVLDAVLDLSDKIDSEFASEPDVAAELHHKFAEVISWNGGLEKVRRTGLQLYHARRAIELRKQHYGERHELVAKDMAYLFWAGGVEESERARYLMNAIQIMRETNPYNLNLPYMLEAYTTYLMMPGKYEKNHAQYFDAAPRLEGQNKYAIAETMLLESLLVFRHHYKTDNSAILSAECKLAYVLAMQDKWSEFDGHYSICRQYGEGADQPNVVNSSRYYKEMIEKVVAEKRNQPR